MCCLLMQDNPLSELLDRERTDGLTGVTIAIADDVLVNVCQKVANFGQLLGILLDALERSLRSLARLA